MKHVFDLYQLLIIRIFWLKYAWKTQNLQLIFFKFPEDFLYKILNGVDFFSVSYGTFQVKSWTFFYWPLFYNGCIVRAECLMNLNVHLCGLVRSITYQQPMDYNTTEDFLLCSWRFNMRLWMCWCTVQLQLPRLVGPGHPGNNGLLRYGWEIQWIITGIEDHASSLWRFLTFQSEHKKRKLHFHWRCTVFQHESSKKK